MKEKHEIEQIPYEIEDFDLFRNSNENTEDWIIWTICRNVSSHHQEERKNGKRRKKIHSYVKEHNWMKRYI
jgi:hypothetical protein